MSSATINSVLTLMRMCENVLTLLPHSIRFIDLFINKVVSMCLSAVHFHRDDVLLLISCGKPLLATFFTLANNRILSAFTSLSAFQPIPSVVNVVIIVVYRKTFFYLFCSASKLFPLFPLFVVFKISVKLLPLYYYT